MFGLRLVAQAVMVADKAAATRKPQRHASRVGRSPSMLNDERLSLIEEYGEPPDHVPMRATQDLASTRGSRYTSSSYSVRKLTTLRLLADYRGSIHLVMAQVIRIEQAAVSKSCGTAASRNRVRGAHHVPTHSTLRQPSPPPDTGSHSAPLLGGHHSWLSSPFINWLPRSWR